MASQTPPRKLDLNTALARIAKMIPLLGSSEANEAAAAFAAIRRTLVSAELSWSDLAQHVRAPDDGTIVNEAYRRGFNDGVASEIKHSQRPPPRESAPRPTRPSRRF